MRVKMKYTGDLDRPVKQTAEAAGIDLFNNEENKIVYSNDSEVFKTGLSIEIPDGYVGLVFPRSSLGFKFDCTLANSVGVIDSDYRGEILVKIHNHGTYPKQILKGERVCQLVIVPCLQYTPEFVDKLSDTERGENGFGSTGRK